VGSSPVRLSKRQILFDPRFVGLIQDRDLRQLSFPFPTFRSEQVTLPRLAPQNLPAPGDLKALGHRFLGFASCNRLWHKEPGNYALSGR
jgi:hypothetical protein